MAQTRRLAAICGELKACALLCDVGCDHGYVAEYALEQGLAERVIVSDVSAPSLQKAVVQLARFGDRVKSVVSDGFDSIDERPDAACICGMGGREILDILRRKSNVADRLILQPMRDVRAVREWLTGNGYHIERDFIAESEGKFYTVIAAVPSAERQKLTEAELEFGATEVKNPGADFMRYSERLLEKYRNLLAENLPDSRRDELAALSGMLAEIRKKAERET